MGRSLPVQSPSSEKRIAAMFDRVAPRYDFLNRLLSAKQDQKWRKALTRHVPFVPGGSFLDVATGTGDVLRVVADTRTEYLNLVGVDVSIGMLERAKVKCADLIQSDRTCEFKEMSAENLTLLSDQFDALSISFGLRNVVDKEKALSEFHRVLKPMGTLLILEFFEPNHSLLAALFQFYFHHILPRIGALLSDREAYRYLPQSVGSFYKEHELRSSLTAKGFTLVQIQSFLFGSCRLVVARKNG